MLNVDAYEGFSAALDGLTAKQKAATAELIWSHRDGNTSVCWITYDLDAFVSVCGGTIPDIIANAYSTRYFVDLESLATDKKRIYINHPDEDISIVGYYFGSLAKDAAPYEYKLYHKVNRREMNVERFAGDGTFMSADIEVQTDLDEDWGGSPELLKVARENGREVIILKKTTKPQSYIRVIG